MLGLALTDGGGRSCLAAKTIGGFAKEKELLATLDLKVCIEILEMSMN